MTDKLIRRPPVRIPDEVLPPEHPQGVLVRIDPPLARMPDEILPPETTVDMDRENDAILNVVIRLMSADISEVTLQMMSVTPQMIRHALPIGYELCYSAHTRSFRISRPPSTK